jgi:hypothetical protein
MGQYLGMTVLGSQLASSQITKNSAGTPKDADVAPTYRIYGPVGIMSNGTGSLVSKDPSAAGGSITNATNASPIVITSASHGLSTGTRVTIGGVLGNSAANGDWQITVVDNNTFSLNGSTGNGAYTSGGLWHVAGLYAINYTPLGANGFASGVNYTVLVTYVMAGVTQADLHTFTCI